MLGRRSALALLALLASSMFASDAQAHRLDAQAFVRKDRKIQIEAWFPSGGPAQGAKVQVFRTGAQLLTEGQTNNEGIFVFSFTEPEPLRVVISDGAGHRKELSIAQADFAQTISSKPSGGGVSPTQGEESSKPTILANRDSGLPIKDVIVGVGFLLALAAFLLSLRNARRLREMANHKGT